MGNTVFPGNIERAAELIRALLPNGWSLDLEIGSRLRRGPHPDANLVVRRPDGNCETFVVEAKPSIQPRQIDDIRRQLRAYAGLGLPMVVSAHLTKRTRELLGLEGISYADTNGNIRIASDNLVIDRTGADVSSTQLQDTSRTSLRGRMTARVIRTLLDTAIAPGEPLKVRDLGVRLNMHAGNISKLLRLLDSEHLIDRDSRGSVTAVDWPALIRAWAPALRSTRVIHGFFEPRGVERFAATLQGWPEPYAITGSFAAGQLAPAAYANTMDVYVSAPNHLAKTFSLKPHPEINNIRIIEPFDDIVFERTITRERLTLASPSQIAADLETLPRRSHEELDALIEWMKRNESEWRVG